jgi:integrase/recombinase XerD
MPYDSAPAKNDLAASAHIHSTSWLKPTINTWQIYLEDQGVSPHTVKAFLSDLNLLASYLPPDKNIGEISTHDLSQFLDWMQNRRGVPCSPKTLARRITSLKAFFRWLHQYGVLIIDPAEKVPQKTVTSPLAVVLTEDETRLILDTAEKHSLAEKPDHRPYALVLLLLSTGIKKGECLGLHLNHLELDASTGPQLFVRYPGPRNRYKERKIALTPAWLETFQKYAGQYSVTDRLFPWSPRRLEYLLEDLSVEAGLEKHVSFDMCRWTCALNDWRSGMEHDKIRQKLGVSKIQWREINLKLERLARS